MLVSNIVSRYKMAGLPTKYKEIDDFLEKHLKVLRIQNEILNRGKQPAAWDVFVRSCQQLDSMGAYLHKKAVELLSEILRGDLTVPGNDPGILQHLKLTIRSFENEQSDFEVSRREAVDGEEMLAQATIFVSEAKQVNNLLADIRKEDLSV